MIHVQPGEGRASSGAVDASDGSRGRGGEERQGKGDHHHHDDYDVMTMTKDKGGRHNNLAV